MVSECLRLWHRTLSLIALCVCPGGPARLIVITLLLIAQGNEELHRWTIKQLGE
jgi:hypothetical protein